MLEAITRNRRAPWMAATAAAVLLLFCGGLRTQAQTFAVVHNFGATATDGREPVAGLLRDASGNLYGTAINGGAAGHGIVFKIDPSGNETIIHTFRGADGAQPDSVLTMDALSNLYGTTYLGGSADYGTVFKIDPSGNETVLHNFNRDGTDGTGPEDGLVMDALGNLYGTTTFDGSGKQGTVFKIDPSGNETILHNFGGGTDGEAPFASLIMDARGDLYGTTNSGGTWAKGTVFKIDPSGNETILHNFNGADGGNPYGRLVMDASGNLYGTAHLGGSGGYGTVFKIDRFGNETVLHHFTGGTDGAYPFAGLVMDTLGNLYGTTLHGGSGEFGVVFKIDPSGNFAVIHHFYWADGILPFGDLTMDASGNLYGTAAEGGSSDLGTVFKIVFSVPFSSFSAKLDAMTGRSLGFKLQASFSPGADAPVIDPATQGMTLTVGTYTVTIPPGAFHQTKKGWFLYEGTIGAVALDVRISQKGASPYELKALASGLDLTSLTNPVTVTLVLGDNNGTTHVNQ